MVISTLKKMGKRKKCMLTYWCSFYWNQIMVVRKWCLVGEKRRSCKVFQKFGRGIYFLPWIIIIKIGLKISTNSHFVNYTLYLRHNCSNISSPMTAWNMIRLAVQKWIHPQMYTFSIQPFVCTYSYATFPKGPRYI